MLIVQQVKEICELHEKGRKCVAYIKTRNLRQGNLFPSRHLLGY
jgi:hypothetical protein